MGVIYSTAKFLRNNSLSIVLFGCFAVFLLGLTVAGQRHYNQEALDHGQPSVSYGQYIASGHFVEAVFENWESEFLQMWALVVLTIFLRQKGSADSKKLRGRMPVDTSSRYSIIRAHSWQTRLRAIGDLLKSHSLGLALLALFIASFALHALGGVHAYNEEASSHSQAVLSLWGYVSSATFWFESLQNWQSEFLAVGTLLLLSIFLRERGSPESKPIGEPNKVTGKG